ncbi:MAG: tRNA (adenosine(37)-N6)-threonylcarbamoyltransferase complex ATPase subunit type 1 TsaE [Patescibacteria group bacterium]|nr:tRNA (adenosine(37)-N6)-threonylcarbamoyltransferase complex ATPase subunit type 1 TsaE [Patescibacteria group bacterium]
MELECQSNSASQTKKIGESLAKVILEEKVKKRAKALGLLGDLGGGKTTFLQGFAKGLGIKEKILSPTFVILKKFEIKNSDFEFFYHIDCYRIEKQKEVLDLGFKKIISSPTNIIAVEWADRIFKILPKDSILISFEFIDKNKRRIILRW